MQLDDEEVADGGGPVQRLSASASLVTSLDRRIVELFDSLEEIRAATTGLSALSDDGGALVAELREKLERWDAKLRIDVDEIKQALLQKLDGIDVDGLGDRMSRAEEAIFNIESAVTRLDRLVSGMVESVPDFITRRVRARAAQPEDSGD